MLNLERKIIHSFDEVALRQWAPSGAKQKGQEYTFACVIVRRSQTTHLPHDHLVDDDGDDDARDSAWAIQFRAGQVIRSERRETLRSQCYACPQFESRRRFGSLF